MSRNLIYLHYVITTKKRQGIFSPDKEKTLFAYILGVTENLNCKLIRINAALNHMHILVKIPTTISASDYIATVKRSTSLFIKNTGLYPKFWGWAREYSVQSVSLDDVERVRQYIINQKEHHKVVSFEDEWLSNLTEEERSAWDWKYLDN